LSDAQQLSCHVKATNKQGCNQLTIWREGKNDYNLLYLTTKYDFENWGQLFGLPPGCGPGIKPIGSGCYVRECSLSFLLNRSIWVSNGDRLFAHYTNYCTVE